MKEISYHFVKKSKIYIRLSFACKIITEKRIRILLKNRLD
jgi:hypothetical protein